MQELGMLCFERGCFDKQDTGSPKDTEIDFYFFNFTLVGRRGCQKKAQRIGLHFE